MGDVRPGDRAMVLQEVDLITNTPAECYLRSWSWLGIPISIPVWLGFGSCTVDGFGRTYPDTGNRSTCLGDSGGPIFWEDFKTLTQLPIYKLAHNIFFLCPDNAAKCPCLYFNHF